MFEEEYDSYDAIPAQVRHLYVQSGDKYVLISAGQFKTAEDVERVQEGLRKEREDHKTTKRRLHQFGELDPDDVLSKLDRFEELEAAAAGKLPEDQINEMVEKRIRSRVAPLERQIKTLETEKGDLHSKVETFQGKERKRTIHDELRKAAMGAKVRDTALEDVLMIGENIFELSEEGRIVTRDGVGVTPGVDPTVWLTETKERRPHWWPESQGAGARGGSGSGGVNNPFTAENWNMTEQGKLVRENPERASQLAKAAGTTVGGKRPAK